MFVFGDLHVHQKDWLTYSGETDRADEPCYNFSIWNYTTLIPDCYSHIPALLDLFLSSDATLCSTMAFPPFRNSNHVVASISIDFPSNSQWDGCFITWLMTILTLIVTVFVNNWEMFHGKISLNSVLLLLVNSVSGSRLELMYISFTEKIKSSLTHLFSF